MVNHGCINGTLEGTDHYASPMPWIGLYIGGASSVCTLLMISDFIMGYRSRKLWIPCKLFQLNSVGLSLVSMTVKLTMDLTTSMPRGIDQLSKLSGTLILCIYMCYIMPSLGVMKDWSNMYALSILVGTVSADICIQMSTGVIVVYFPEHIIAMCLMVLQLLMLWYSAWVAKARKRTSIAKYKSYFLKGNGTESFLHRLKVCYLYGFSSNPQFLASRHLISAWFYLFSISVFFILSQATVRSFVWKKLKSCTDASDYGWSVVIIFFSQFVSVAVGMLVVTYRFFVMQRHTEKDRFHASPIGEPYGTSPIWKYQNICHSIAMCISSRVSLGVDEKSTAKGRGILQNLMDKFFKYNSKHKTSIQGFEYLKHRGEMGFNEWTLQRSVQSLERMIGKCQKQKLSPLSTIFNSHKAHCSKDQFGRPSLRCPSDRLLPLVLLVKLAEVSLPTDKSRPIVLAFREAFDIVHFVQKHENTITNDVKETEVAKAVWMASGFKGLLPARLKNYDSSNLNFECAKDIIAELSNTVLNDMVSKELRTLIASLNSQRYTTLDALYHCMEDLFVVSLKYMLAQLPQAIFRAVYSSSVEEFEKRVRTGLAYLCKFESWEGITWELPEECNCSSLLDNVTTESRDEALEEHNVVATLLSSPPNQREYAAQEESISVNEITEIGGSNLMQFQSRI